MKRLNLFHFAVIYVTAICSITSIPRYLILKGNYPHSLDLVLYSLFTTLLFITIIFMIETAYCKYIVPTICNLIDVVQDQRSRRVTKIKGNTKRNGRLSIKLFHKTIDDNKEKTENSILYSHEEEVRLDRERIKKENDDTIKEVMSYFEATFKDILTSNEMSVMKENIMALNNKTEIKTAVSRRLNGVTSKDLYHLARNIGKRLGCSNMQIAHFIKKSFQLMLEDTEILTISSKLTCNEGRFTIKIIPIGTPLVAQSLPFSRD